MRVSIITVLDHEIIPFELLKMSTTSQRITEAITRETDVVRQLRLKLSEAEFNERMRTDLSPFFRNPDASESLIQLKTHLWEYGVILGAQQSPWFITSLKFFIDQFNRAKDRDKQAVQQSLLFWFSYLNEALAKYTEAFHLEALESSMAPNLLARAAFRQLGDILEASMLPLIRQVYSLFSLVGIWKLQHDPIKDTFGPETKMIYQRLLCEIPIHQWRNIAQHSSYTYDEQSGQIECKYGSHSQYSVCIAPPELLQLLKQTDHVFGLHKIAIGFFTMDNLDLLKNQIRSVKVTRETVVCTILTMFEVQGFDVHCFEMIEGHWEVTLKNPLQRSQDEFSDLITHAASFAAMQPDLEINIKLLGPDDQSWQWNLGRTKN